MSANVSSYNGKGFIIVQDQLGSTGFVAKLNNVEISNSRMDTSFGSNKTKTYYGTIPSSGTNTISCESTSGSKIYLVIFQ